MTKLVHYMDETIKNEFNLESILRIGYNHRRINKNFKRIDRIEH